MIDYLPQDANMTRIIVLTTIAIIFSLTLFSRKLRTFLTKSDYLRQLYLGVIVTCIIFISIECGASWYSFFFALPVAFILEKWTKTKDEIS